MFRENKVLAKISEFTVIFSSCRAAKATEGGLFTNEIIPVVTKIKDKDGNERTIKVTYTTLLVVRFYLCLICFV